MSDYQDRYREKLMDAASVAARVEDGWVIGMDAATAHTPRIMSALAARAAAGEVKNVKVQTLLDVYPLEFYADKSLDGKLNGVSWFAGGGARKAINAGFADFIPNYYRDIPGLIRRYYDYDAVCAFLIALNQTDRTHINWNWARFEWMMEHPEFDKSAESTIGLWWSGGKVVGAAIYDMYFGEAFCGVLPGFETLYPRILDYAYRKLKDDSGLAVAIHQENEAEIKAALQAGFAPTDQKETVMELSLDRNFTSVLPGGLRLREMDQIADRDALEWLFWQGFDHGDDRDAFERSRDRAAHVRKHFNRTLSLSAADPSGEPVSHCSLWFHPDTDYAYVEPVCTIPGLRGRGIASALLSEAFSRAKALGAKKAYVISDLPFYEKLGFEKTRRCVFYRKK